MIEVSNLSTAGLPDIAEVASINFLQGRADSLARLRSSRLRGDEPALRADVQPPRDTGRVGPGTVRTASQATGVAVAGRAAEAIIASLVAWGALAWSA